MFNKSARDASTQNPVNSTHPESAWAWDLIAEAVPALPCGAVTLIILNGDDPFTSHTATVGDLMANLFMTQRRFAHISIGDPDSDMAEVFAAAINEEAEGRAVAYVDRDYKVMARLGDGGGFVYPCGIPSLDNVERFLAADEHGDDRLLILEGFERARPYKADGPALIPNGVPLSAEDIDAWRTADLRAFAQSRPNAPTVVVWHGVAVESAGAKRSMGDAADVVVTHRAGEEHDWLSVSVRSEHGCWDDHA